MSLDSICSDSTHQIVELMLAVFDFPMLRRNCPFFKGQQNCPFLGKIMGIRKRQEGYKSTSPKEITTIL